MCGICGVAFSDPGRRVDEPILRRMTDIIRYRGPDSDGFHNGPGIGLGVRRLSIIDLDTGDQPISNEDGTLTLICNGEIYNFVELRERMLAAGHRFRTKSDVEVILHLYEDHGADCVHHLRGMFGFALWDSSRRRLMLARDRLGIKPLHYAITPEALYFGSEMKSILAADCVERRLDLQALKDLFTLGFVVGPKTMLTSIRRLQPGHYLLFKGGDVSFHQYWDVNFPELSSAQARRGADEWAEALREELRESVRIHLRSDVPVGAWLSGGIDSSAIVSMMTRFPHRSIQTVSLAFEYPELDEVGNQPTLNEFPGYTFENQRVTCNAGDFTLFPKALWHCEDISATGIEIPCMLLSRAAARNGKVVLVGEGSDELFGGYQWFRADKILQPLGKLPLSVRRFMLMGPLIPSRWPGASRILLASPRMDITRYTPMIGPARIEILSELFSDNLGAMLGQTVAPDWDLTVPEGFSKWDPLVQLQYYELKIRLPDFILHHMDRTSMAYSLEVRVPFLDHKVVEFCAAIPPSLKLRGLTEKYILRKAMQPLLPREIYHRKKRGLRAPFKQWMQEKLPEFAEELLSARSLRAKGYFKPEIVERMLAQHRTGAKDYGVLLIGVLAVQLWDDLFLSNHKRTKAME